MRHATEFLSLRKQERLRKKKNALLEKKKISRQNRKAARKLVMVMAEVKREEIRENIANATSISVALDETKGRKIVRIRGDRPTRPFTFDAVLGMYGTSYLPAKKKTIGAASGAVESAIQEDHAQHAAKELDAFLKRFFTPLASRKRGRSAGGSDVPFNADELESFKKK